MAIQDSQRRGRGDLVGAAGRRMPKRAFSLWLVVTLSPVLCPSIAPAGVLDTWLHGTVTDTEGLPLAGVRVLVRTQTNQDQTLSLESSTNRHGKYRLLLRRGDLRYVMVLDRPGYQTLVKVVQPLRLSDRDQVKAFTSPPDRRTFQVDFVMPSEEAVVERARSDGGRGEVPGEELRYAARVLQNRAVAAAHAGALDLAEELFLDAIRLDPTLEHAHSGLATLLHARGDLEGVVNAAARAWELGAREPQMTLLWCEALEDLQRHEELEGAVAHLRSLDPLLASDHLLRRATRAAGAGADSDAYELLLGLLRFDAANTEALYLAGEVALRIGQVERAADHLQTLLDASPEHPYATTARALLGEIERLKARGEP